MRLILLSLLGVFIFSGCSYKAKFEQKQVVNFVPFTEQTMVLLGNTDYDMDDDYKLYLQEIDIHKEDPEAKEMFLLQTGLMSTMREIMIYSLQLSSISGMDANGSEKANMLADMIERIHDNKNTNKNIINLDITQEQYKELVQNMRQSSDLLIAMQGSQVFINEIVRNSMLKLDRVRELGDNVAQKIDIQIDEKFKESIKFDKEVHKRRQRNMKALRYLAHYEETGKGLEKVQALNIFKLKNTIDGKRKLSLKELDKAFGAIQSNLTELRSLQLDVKPDIQEYHAYLQELQSITKRHNDSVKKTRRSMITWARAHSAMSNGKWNPSEWFGISDAGSLLMGAARKHSPL